MPFQDEEARQHLAWIVGAGGEHDPLSSADELLAEFGSLGAVLAANPRRLNRVVKGSGLAMQGILRFNAAIAHVLRSRIADRPLLSCLSDVIDYLRFDLSFVSQERVRILYMDARNHLIRDEQANQGSTTRVVVAVQSIVQRAEELGSVSLILVHNHPSGDPTPSRQDIDLTLRIVAEARLRDVVVLDHLIVGAERVYSFHHAGILP